jgi:hypothetical protein
VAQIIEPDPDDDDIEYVVPPEPEGTDQFGTPLYGDDE